MDCEWTKIKKIECLGEVDDYVYDLSIKDQDPFFFANDILVHNTDSVYFSIYKTLKQQIESGNIEWNPETAIQLYDAIEEQVNESFPGFMELAFHAPRKNGEIIRCARELVGDRALFITKKRYAINIIDKEGKRKDTGNKPGEIKAMGLDLKRADTPKFIQEFLMEVLKMVLAGVDKKEVTEHIVAFKKKLAEQPAWEKGSPKAVNNLTKYGDMLKNVHTENHMVPGHVRAAINFNHLREMNNDTYTQQIVDGMKIVVCKLKKNPMGFLSVAFPVDEKRLPAWFTALPFDDKLMETKLVDEKIKNLLGVLEWGIEEELDIDSTFGSLFDFG